MKYIVKNNNKWFKENTEALEVSFLYRDKNKISHSIFKGIYIIGDGNKPYDDYFIRKGHKSGDEVYLHEVCTEDQFNIID